MHATDSASSFSLADSVKNGVIGLACNTFMAVYFMVIGLACSMIMVSLARNVRLVPSMSMEMYMHEVGLALCMGMEMYMHEVGLALSKSLEMYMDQFGLAKSSCLKEFALKIGLGGRQRSMSRGDRDVVEDGDLKAIPITLPLLPSPEGRDSSLEAGDWLIQLAPLVGDLSKNAASWWRRVMQATTDKYSEWLYADPLARLKNYRPRKLQDLCGL